MTLDDYILSHIDPESDYLHALYRGTPSTATRTCVCSIRAWRPVTFRAAC